MAPYQNNPSSQPPPPAHGQNPTRSQPQSLIRYVPAWQCYTCAGHNNPFYNVCFTCGQSRLTNPIAPHPYRPSVRAAFLPQGGPILAPSTNLASPASLEPRPTLHRNPSTTVAPPTPFPQLPPPTAQLNTFPQTLPPPPPYGVAYIAPGAPLALPPPVLPYAHLSGSTKHHAGAAVSEANTQAARVKYETAVAKLDAAVAGYRNIPNINAMVDAWADKVEGFGMNVQRPPLKAEGSGAMKTESSGAVKAEGPVMKEEGTALKAEWSSAMREEGSGSVKAEESGAVKAENGKVKSESSEERTLPAPSREENRHTGYTSSPKNYAKDLGEDVECGSDVGTSRSVKD